MERPPISQNPSGTFSFRGKVPVELSFVYDGPLDFHEAIQLANVSGPGFVPGLKSRSFPSAEAAAAAFDALFRTRELELLREDMELIRHKSYSPLFAQIVAEFDEPSVESVILQLGPAEFATLEEALRIASL